MTVEQKKIFAGLAINANLREYDRLGEISEFIHEMADVYVNHDAKTVTVVTKESIPIEKDEIAKLIGIEGLDLAQAAAKGNAVVGRIAQLEQDLKQTKDALEAANGALEHAAKQSKDASESAGNDLRDMTAQRDALLGKLQRVSAAAA